MANEERWRGRGHEREQEGRPGERDARPGGRVGDRGAGRESFPGRGHDGRGYDHRAQPDHSREDYGRAGYGEQRGSDADSFSRSGEEGPQREGYGWQRDDFAQEASGRSFAGNEGRGFGYGGDYRGSHGGGGYGGDDRGRRGYGARPSQERSFFERAADEVSSWFGDSNAEHRREQDHRGRGPKGYKRLDARIQEDVNDRLADDPYLDASDLEVSVSGGEVTLSGTADDRRSRRRAEDITEQVSGVTYVQNNIRVRQVGGAASDRDGQAPGRGPAAGSTATPGIGSGETGRAESDDTRS